MKTLADALEIRLRVFGAFEMAAAATDPAERRRWLTFALVGAGPTGVELAGQIRELALHTLRREYAEIDPGTPGFCCSTEGANRWRRSGPSLRRRPLAP